MAAKDLRFVDLFAGIGGFHAALSTMGMTCVDAIEIDKKAAAVYRRNWGVTPRGDITEFAGEGEVDVPAHDVLTAGFPCQPFSKSGAQRGMDETRGTLYWNILRIIQDRQPTMVLLENVRNLAGPRHLHEWDLIVETLRAEGYRVSDEPSIFSPHLLPRSRGGRPQVRERVFIAATRVGDPSRFNLEARPVVSNSPVEGWDPQRWKLSSGLPLDRAGRSSAYRLSPQEELWIDTWDELVEIMWEMVANGDFETGRLPGFPIWADEWPRRRRISTIGLPKWKATFVEKNAELYERLMSNSDARRWIESGRIFEDDVPPSRRKLEWQAQDTPSLWKTVMHLRPSGIRAKRATYLPALVAITQTSIYGPQRRRLSPSEAARLQGLPDSFDFGDQPDAATYRQLGNGVSTGVVWHVLREHARRDQDILKVEKPDLLKVILGAPDSPDELLAKHQPAG